MLDSFSRRITYLRLSVTDKCNLKCAYCSGADSSDKELSDAAVFGYEQRLAALRAAARIGITKVRLTGGEPMCWPRLLDFVKDAKGVEGISSVCMTTNGTMLADAAADLKRAGLDGINVSLDTLKPERFERIAGAYRLDSVLSGIESALSAGIRHLRLNVVLIGGLNDDEIPDFVRLTASEPLDVRFIELMPTLGGALPYGSFVSAEHVLEVCPGLKPVASCAWRSVARYYKADAAKGMVGLISPVISPFCASCDRIRITYDGYVRPCLFSENEISLLSLDEDGMVNALRCAIENKPKEHPDLRSSSLFAGESGRTGRSMRRIGG